MDTLAMVKLYLSCRAITDRIIQGWRRPTITIAVLAAVAASSPVSAQIVEMRESNGKQIYCAQSGLRSFAMPCGMDTSNDYIFIGSVLSAVQISEREKRLLVAPEEIFRGNPSRELRVTTSQGDCLPDIQPGDRWLFYLWRDNETSEVLLGYASGSAPVAEAQESIALLRRLAQMPDSGVIRGDVQQFIREDNSSEETYSSVPKHKIVAKRVADGVKYTAVTDQDGRYEFEPLPSGTYQLTANTEKSQWAEEGRIEVHPHGCSYVDFELHPNGMISGWIRDTQGKPAKYKSVTATPAAAEGSEFRSAISDEHGYFEIRGLRPGRYLLGININSHEGSPERQSRVYYPGVRSRDLAVTIELGLAEQRTNINFQLLAK